MAPCFLAFWLVSAAGTQTVYRFTDARGQEHFVDQLDEVPPGLKAQPVDLTGVPLNPEVAKELSKAAENASAAAAKKLAEAQKQSAAPPPPGATLSLMWSVALTFAFVGLWIIRRLTQHRAPELAAALGVIRILAGSAALMCWGATLYEYRNSRHWLAQSFPPLRALDDAQQTKNAAEARQKQLEKDTEQMLKNN